MLISIEIKFKFFFGPSYTNKFWVMLINRTVLPIFCSSELHIQKKNKTYSDFCENFQARVIQVLICYCQKRLKKKQISTSFKLSHKSVTK